MKKVFGIFLAVVLAITLSMAVTHNTYAAKKRKFVKFGSDPRAKAWKHKKWTTSNKKYHWRMSDPWGGILFHDIAIHFADSVRACSGGRLDIKVYPTGSIVPAMQIFEATQKGTLDCFHSWPGYWKGKNEAFVAFASVPFGLDAEGYSIWLYERGGAKMLNELYNRYGMVGFPCGNAGQELGLFSNKKATKMADFKGMKVRTPGWYMDILTRMGVSVTPLPASEIYLALERGVIDACEFSAPSVDYPMGFHEITKYVIQPGVHQPACQLDLAINKKKWDELPEDLKVIVEICCKETQIWSWAWMENLNIPALKLMGKHVQYITMADETLNKFAETTHAYLEELKKKYPDVKKVLDSQEKFRKDFAQWRELRGRVAPWPYEKYISGSQEVKKGTHLQ